MIRGSIIIIRRYEMKEIYNIQLVTIYSSRNDRSESGGEMMVRI